ncbi:MAG: hypothetical protein AAGD10_17260 [Myxococcota bacterium]
MNESVLVQYRIDGESSLKTDYASEVTESGLLLSASLPPGTSVFVRLPVHSNPEIVERVGRVEGQRGRQIYVRFQEGQDEDTQTLSLAVQTRDTLDIPTEDLLYAERNFDGSEGEEEDDEVDTLF